MRRNAAAALVFASLAGAALLPARAWTHVPYLPVPRGAAVILNTGSTNTAGYRVVVERSGDAEYVVGATRGAGRLDPKVTAAFFADLGRAMPLSRLRVLACMKSASFGTETYVWWRGSRSPDLSCPVQPAGTALNDDVARIAAALQLAGGRTIPMLPNEPRKAAPTAYP